MKIVADLHLHSKYSRAVSQQMVLPTMAQVAVEKGIHLLSASDWTHPAWFKEIQTSLEEKEEGVYGLTTGTEEMKEVRFVLSTEISSIYKQGEKLRRIHNLVFASSFAKAEEFTKALIKKGCNVSSDGRPIVGLSAKQLLELLLEIDEKGFLIPCHVWTPHFGLYGSASGFDSIEEAFGDLSGYIYGIETGLSSDPEMNWQIPELRNRSILSFSDAHSPAKMGREATVFELSNLSFPALKSAILSPLLKESTPGVLYTVEFYPEEGKYHFSGHRNCKVRFTPEELKEKGNVCPVCRRVLTEGVFVRLSHLAGKDSLVSAQVKQNAKDLHWLTDPLKLHPPYVKLVPLLEIVAETMGSTVASQKVKDLYQKTLRSFGSELDILLKVSITEIEKLNPRLAEGIAKVRSGDIVIEPGFDGEYGVVRIWGEGNKVNGSVASSGPQMSIEF